MIPEILEMVGDILARKRRIDEATNDLVTTSPEFAQYEHAVGELNAAVADLRSAIQHVESAQADKIIWRLDGMQQQR